MRAGLLRAPRLDRRRHVLAGPRQCPAAPSTRAASAGIHVDSSTELATGCGGGELLRRRGRGGVIRAGDNTFFLGTACHPWPICLCPKCVGLAGDAFFGRHCLSSLARLSVPRTHRLAGDAFLVGIACHPWPACLCPKCVGLAGDAFFGRHCLLSLACLSVRQTRPMQN